MTRVVLRKERKERRKNRIWERRRKERRMRLILRRKERVKRKRGENREGEERN